MGNGNLEVGNETPTRKSGQPTMTSARSGSPDQRIDSPPNTEHPCGAMSQQAHEFPGNFSTPQKFVRLVGCRETRRTTTGTSPYPNPAKR